MTDGFEIQGRLTVDKSEVNDALQEVGANAGKKLPAAKLDVDTSPAWGKLSQIDTLQSKVITNFAKKTTLDIEPKGDKDTEKAFKRISDLAQHMDKITIRPEIQSMDISDTAKRVMELNRQWDELNAKPEVKLKADVVGAAGATGDKTTDLTGLARGFRTGTRYSPMYAGAGLLEGGSILAKFGIVGGMAGGAAIAGYAGMKSVVGASEDQRKLTQFTEKTMGGTASVAAAKSLSDETGFLASDFMNAAIAGKELSATYGMQTEQIANLVKVSADLAAESPYKDLQTVADAMGEMKSAMGGDEKAAERLGLTLGDNYMKTSAFGGVLKSTWDTLNEATQYQYRYKEMLLQTQSVLGASKDQADISTQTRELNKELGQLKTALGDELVGPMTEFVALVRQLAAAIPHGAPGAAVATVSTPIKVGTEAIPKSWLDVANLPRTLIELPAQIVGQTLGTVAAKLWPGTGGTTPTATKVDVNVNVNNNNNSQIDAGASAPPPH